MVKRLIFLSAGIIKQMYLIAEGLIALGFQTSVSAGLMETASLKINCHHY